MSTLLPLSGPLWMWFTLAALVCWATRILIDEYLTKDSLDGESSIYKDSIYGTVISARFAGYASVPFLLVYFVFLRGTIAVEDLTCLLVAGALYLLHFHYFFILLKASSNLDASWTESAASGNLVLTPVILYLLINERFNIVIVIGIVLVAVSVGILFFRTRDLVKNNYSAICLFIATISGSSILSDYAYEGNAGALTITGLLGFFYLGMALCGRVFYSSLPQQTKSEINQTVKSNFKLFSGAELVDLTGTLFFQLAIATAPSVIFALAMLEFMPIACLLVAALLLLISWSKHLKSVARAQFQQGYVKVFASMFCFVGAILIIGSGPIVKAIPDITLWASEITQSTQKMVASVTQQEVQGTADNESGSRSDLFNLTNADTGLEDSDLLDELAGLYPDKLLDAEQRELNRLFYTKPVETPCLKDWPDCVKDKELVDQIACHYVYQRMNTSIQERLKLVGQPMLDTEDLIQHATSEELTASNIKCRNILAQQRLDDELTAQRDQYDIELLCPYGESFYKTGLSHGQILKAQQKLAAYAARHPQLGFIIPAQSIDGVYGRATCRAIVEFEAAENLSSITGKLDEEFYSTLINYSFDSSTKLSRPVVISRVNAQLSADLQRQTEPAQRQQNSNSVSLNTNDQNNDSKESKPNTFKQRLQLITHCIKQENWQNPECEGAEAQKRIEER